MGKIIGNFLVNIGKKIREIGEKILGNSATQIPEKLVQNLDQKHAGEILLPERYRESFEVKELREKENEWILTLLERKNQIPLELKGKQVVSNGYKDPIEILHFPFEGRKLYLKFYRRKWKEKESNQHFCNHYHFHKKGMKTTDEFGAFLKEMPRSKLSQYFRTFGGF